MMKHVSKFFYILDRDTKTFIWVLFLFLLSSLLEAFSIGLIGPFLALATNPSRIEHFSLLSALYIQFDISEASFITLIGAGIAIIFLIKSVLYFFSQLAIFKFSFGLQQKISCRLFKAYLLAPYTFYLGGNSSAIIKNISLETHNFSHELLIPVLEAIISLITITLLITLLGFTNLLLLAMILAGIIPVFILFLLYKEKIKYWGEEASRARRGIILTVNHGLGSFKESRVLGCESYFFQKMEEESLRLKFSQLSFHVSQKIPRILLEALLIIPLVVFVSTVEFSGDASEALIDTLSVFAVASIRLMPASGQFLSSLGNIQTSTHTLDILYHDLKSLDNSKDLEEHFGHKVVSSNALSTHRKATACQPLSFVGSVSLSKVFYRYPEAVDSALADISLKIRKGTSVALIGKSGAGKTTLVDVMLGLLEPESGTICVDGVPIQNNIRAWRSLIGYIPQVIFLTDDTIARNIAFGVPDHLINQERLEKAVVLAQLQDLIEDLPNGLQSVVGERGIRLSGGQRQRIGIARVLYHEKEILVLDEATSALDNETEAAISEAVQNFSGIKTLIVVAHRLTTIQHCDVVYVIDKGRIVKSGSYQEVTQLR